MTEDLVDEVSAINSIFSPDTLLPDKDTDRAGADAETKSDAMYMYTLSLPLVLGDDAAAGLALSTLKMQFPATYPAVPPAVLGTHSAGAKTKRGAAARELALFRDAVAGVYEPGAVCLFDAIERFKAAIVAEAASAGGHGHHHETNHEEQKEHKHPPHPDPASNTAHFLPPQWTVSGPRTELKSTFVARVCPVSSVAEARAHVAYLLDSDKRVRSAHHPAITAWRVRGPASTMCQDCDDDGEAAAGARLLRLMQVMGLWDCMVVVTRWYGGQKLGSRRFALINNVAREAFVRAGLVQGGGESGKAGR